MQCWNNCAYVWALGKQVKSNVQVLQKEATDLQADGSKLRTELEDGFKKILKACEGDFDDDEDDEDDEDEAEQADV